MNQEKIVGEGITFDDVLLLPGYAEVLPQSVDTRTRISRRVTLNVPITSAAMDTVTESALAIALAQEGGLGVIHKNLPIEGQVLEVEVVKRSENGIIVDPVTLPPGETVATARLVMRERGISGIPVVEGEQLVGILTSRDLRFQEDGNRLISEVMTKENLITAPRDTTLEKARAILQRHKVEKLLLVDAKFRLRGLITKKDIDKLVQFPQACRDERGRLRVGAAVGVQDFARVEALLAKDVDLIVVDTAHGHSKNVIETVRELKRTYDIEVVAGNVATAEGAKALADAGADGVKVGIGPGAICTTRVISGAGVPQVTAIMECARALTGSDVPVIADGGVRYSGDITKALAAGAHAVMLGSLFAGLEESPGELVLYRGRRFKLYRGMGALGAMVKGSADRYTQEGLPAPKLVPEGVEGRVPYRGRLAEFVYQLVGGLRAGMGYCGAATIAELREKGRFVRVSAAGVRESHPHDIIITREAPNYSGFEVESEAERP
jgi:IMP dehydrogenase